MRWSRGFSAAVAGVAVLVVYSPPAATAAPVAPDRVGIKLLDAPVSGANDPRARIYIVDQLEAGTTITRHIRATNYSSNVSTVSMYPAAASISGGQFNFAAGRAGNDLTSWTSLTPATAAVAAGAAVDATVTIAVPKDAVSGERYAVLWAQVASAPGTGGVRQISRVGVRIYLDVSGTTQPTKFAVTGIAASRSRTGQPQITATVRNTGTRAVDVAGTVGLSAGPGGQQVPALKTGGTTTIAPGGTGTVSTAFNPVVSAGPWLATVKLTSGTTHAQAAARVTFPVAAAAPVSAPLKHGSSAIGWWIGGSAALLVLVIAGGGLILRRRRQAQIETP